MLPSNKEIEIAVQGMWDVAKKVADKLDTSNKKCNELQARFDFIDNAINRKNEDIKNLETIIKDNSDKINEKNNKIASQYVEIEKLQNLQSKFLELEENYIKVINENTSLKFELETISKSNSELETIKKEYSELLLQYEQLKIDFNNVLEKLKISETSQKDLEIAKKELMNSKYEIINRNEQIDKLKISKSEYQSSNINLSNKVKQLEEKNVININEIEKLKNEIIFLNEKNISLEQEVEQVSLSKSSEMLNYIAKFENIKNEITYCDTIRLNTENRLKELEAQLLENNKSFEKDNNLLAELEQYKKKFEILKLENEKSKKDNETLKIKYYAEAEKLTNNINLLKEKLISSTTDNQAYKEKISELQQQIASIDSNESVAEENNEYKELVGENEKLMDIITKLKDELDSNKAGLKQLATENAKLKETIKDDKKDNIKLSKVSKVIEELKKNNKELEEENQSLQTELKSYKKRVYDEDSMFADIYKLEKDDVINNYVEQIEKLKEDNQSLQCEIVKLSDEKQAEKSTKLNSNKEELVNKIGEFLEKLEKKI